MGKSLAGERGRQAGALVWRWRSEKDEMVGLKCPRRINRILPGRPQGVATSHGTGAG
jgi:hypothetical protein